MNKKQILLGTHNHNKVKEMKAILSDFPVELLSLNDLDIEHEVEENGETYLDNALLKAIAFSNIARLPCISDDSGLEVDVLDGRPGVKSARFADEPNENQSLANNEKLLSELKNVPQERRNAHFTTVVVLANAGKKIFSCRGECHGQIIFSPRGTNGFGYDPIFEVAGHGKTFAELPAEIKNQISHRAKALANFKTSFLNFIHIL